MYNLVFFKKSVECHTPPNLISGEKWRRSYHFTISHLWTKFLQNINFVLFDIWRKTNKTSEINDIYLAGNSLCVTMMLSVVAAQELDPFEALASTIPGTPGMHFASFYPNSIFLILTLFCAGEDYPIFAFPPETSFICAGQVQGYYADPEADCQSFHICANLGDGDLTKYSFLCPNGTLFNQQYFICDWWFNVDCSLSESFYSLNTDIALEQAANSPEGGLGVIGAGDDITALTTSYLPSYPSSSPQVIKVWENQYKTKNALSLLSH